MGSLGAVVRASATTPTAKKPQPLNLTPYELLERVDALFSTLEAAQAEADGADGAARRPKEELKHIATKLGPLADALLLPMKRFDADVAALADDLKRRDTSADAELKRIRSQIAKTLERGRFGALDEEAEAAPAKAKGESARRSGSGSACSSR